MDVVRVFHLVVGDVVEQHFLVFRVEGRQAGRELIQNNTQRVQVKGVVVARLEQHLRCHVFWTATITVCHLVLSESHFAEPEICDTEMPVPIDKYVLRLHY